MTIWAHRGMFATALLSLAAACADDPTATTAPRPRVTVATEHARVRTGVDLPTAPAATPAISAVTALTALAPRWGAPDGTAELVAVATVPVAGGDIVRVAQRVDGIEIDRSEVRAFVGPGGKLLAAAGELVPADLPRDRDGFRIDARAAVARAVDGPGGALTERPGATVDEAWYRGDAGDVVIERARARRRWHKDGAALVPAWVVEVYAGDVDATHSTAERVVIAARDGAVLARRDLTVDAFRYRVWADADGRPLDGPIADYTPNPTGLPGGPRPPFIAPSMVSIDGLNHPSGSSAADPWLNPGAGDTFGNNVDAYSDINAPDGFTLGDFRASTTSAGAFDRTYDTSADALASTDQQQAAIAQLFYTINWLHDDWYDAGFTESAGNAQGDNFGRGGAGGDVFLAEAQDSANDGARNNANMSTPSDGMSPRMQVYLWSGVDERSLVFTPTGPGLTPRGAGFGPRAYDLVGVVRAASDGVGASPDDGCEPFTTNVVGTIALVNRGNCTGEQKAVNAQAAGALGLLIAHNLNGSPAPGLPNDQDIPDSVTIPVMSMSNAAGVELRAALATGPITATMHRRLGPEFDAALDALVVAHEFGHYLHHRLSDCGSVMCSAQSEGWGDFVGLLTASRAGDNLDGAYAAGIAAANGDPYFGIRRAPYSVDPSKNAFRFSMVAEGVDLPTHPLAFAGANSEVHNAGEVWAAALWEAYIALQKARGSATFDDTRRKMQRYVVAGLLMSPTDASFTETRSAILAAARAADPADAAVLAGAFAVRGLGSCAISPPKDSTEFIGATDSFETRGNAAAMSAELAIDITDCDDDGALDVGETASITIPVTNVGSDTLDGVQVTAASTTAGLTVTGGPVVLGTLTPDAGGTATFQVTLGSATGPAAATVDVTITSPGGCTETRQIVLPVRLEADDQRLASSTDRFDALVSPWTPIGDFGNRAWTLQADTALDHHWNGADLGTVSDSALESPDLIAGSGTVTVAFDHTYQFEFSADTFFDGGMIEVTTDGGATWRDVSELVTSVPYDGLLGVDSGNPLGDRMAFGDRNPSFPATDHVVLDFGTRLAGTTFKLRFRIGTDQAVGGPGWSIDDLVVTGITNKPFPEVIADAGACSPEEGGDDGGGCCSTGSGPGASIAAGAVVALLVRRRRRGAAAA